MGAAESTADEPAASSSTSSSDPLDELPDISGWRVLNVKLDSPCDGLGLVPYMDLISHVNSSPLSEHESSLLQHIRPHVPVSLTLFSLSTLTSRTVTVTPRPWRGDGLLGLMIRHEQLTASSPQDCFHVLSVQPASPAARAGLQAGADYLLGTDRLVFRGWAQLDNWLRHSEGKDSTVFVFNSRAWRVREVRMRVGRHWGGEGSLGADLAQGWVHRLPVLEDPQRREVRLERKSEVRRGKRSESGLQRQDGGQLLLNLCLPTEGGGNGSSDDSVPLLTIRIREPGEYSALPAAANSSSRQPQRSSQPAHDHQHGDSHSHSHGHGQGSHAHSHGPAAVARNGPSSSPASAAVSNDAGLKATAVGCRLIVCSVRRWSSSFLRAVLLSFAASDQEDDRTAAAEIARVLAGGAACSPPARRCCLCRRPASAYLRLCTAHCCLALLLPLSVRAAVSTVPVPRAQHRCFHPSCSCGWQPSVRRDMQRRCCCCCIYPGYTTQVSLLRALSQLT